MANTYKTIINGVQGYPIIEGLKDVILIVNYIRQAKSNEYIAESAGECKVPMPDQKDFIPFESLTNDIIASWVEAEIDFLEVDKTLDEQIQNQIEPKIVSFNLPWNEIIINNTDYLSK
jgi:hypothetical protein